MSKDLQLVYDGEYGLNRCGEYVRGIELLGQMYIMELLTVKGSMKYLPLRGCGFIPRLRRAKTEFDIMVAFCAADHAIERSLRRDVTSKTPRSERYSSATISNIMLDGDSVQLQLTITNQDGQFIHLTTPSLQL